MDNQFVRRNNGCLFGIVIGVIIGVIVTGLVIVLSRPIRPAAIEIIPPEPTGPLPTEAPLPTATSGLIHVFVSGAVSVPDVYELPLGSLVKDAIVAAGGFTAEADQIAVNQALRLRDEDHIHVPVEGEAVAVPPISRGDGVEIEEIGSGGSFAGELININTASLAELETLPGIGPSLGQNIIDYREANGPFEEIEDILKVSGIGDAKFGAIQDLITAGN